MTETPLPPVIPSPFDDLDNRFAYFSYLTAPGGLDDQPLITHELHIGVGGKPEYVPVGVLLDPATRDEEDLAALTAYEHVYHSVDFTEGQSSDEPDWPTARPVVDLGDADVLSSALVDVDGKPTGYHTIALDIDLPVRVRATDTPGHHHLYIDHPISWSDYVKLLDVLEEIGLLEPGYVSASKEREATMLRLPWVHKDDSVDAVNFAVPPKPEPDEPREVAGDRFDGLGFFHGSD